MNPAPTTVFLGSVHAHTGYGAASRAYMHAFLRGGVDLSVIKTDRAPTSLIVDSLEASCMKEPSRRSMHIWHTEPDGVTQLTRRIPQLVVLTTWETDSLHPVYVDALNRAGEIWVPSRYNEDVFSRQLKVPIFRIPHPVRQSIRPRFDRLQFDREMGLPEGCFVFACVASWQERKNLAGLVEAFLRAFPDDPTTVLMIKTSFNFTPEGCVRAQILEAIARANPPDKEEAAARVRIFPDLWPEDCLASLCQRTDCYVSLHRGEGWCYPLFDAACSGTPVIATAYAGPLDYLDRRYHGLVRYQLIPVSQAGQSAHFAFDSTMLWAKPDVLHAATLMREVREHPERARQRAAEGAALLRQTYSLEAVGGIARERLRWLSANLASHGAPALPHAAGSPVQEARLLTTPGTAAAQPSCPSSCI